MKKLPIILLFLLATSVLNPVFSQISFGGTPKSFSPNKAALLSAVPVNTMPKVDVAALLKEDAYNDELKDQPWRFGENLYVDYNPNNSGVWNNLTDGGRLWRLTVSSQGALTLNLTFNRFHLPEGAEMFIYNSDHSVVLGKFDSRNNQNHGYLATVPIPGESLTIEYYEPAGVEFNGEINLWRVTHGYRSASDYAKGLNTSGSCNVNAACSQGDPIRDQIRSVAMLVTGGNGFCTGALINNTSNNGTPYFLTANHCSYDQYDNPVDPSTLAYWFNWQSETCSNATSSPSYNSISGATTRAKYENSDFWLLELNDTPPLDYNVYYAGWNRSPLTSISGKCWCIHHPDGDVKKISWVNQGVTTSSYLGETGDGANHWRVGAWSDGTTTEGGSSGSPLFDSDFRIIGQLHGGYAACDVLQPDYYGKLAASWSGGNTSSTKLSNWLDPSNTGVLTLDGFDPSILAIDASVSALLFTIDSTLNDSSIITPAVYLCNLGTETLTSAQVQYQLTGLSGVSMNWSGSLATHECTYLEFPEVQIPHNSYNATTVLTVTDDQNTENNSAHNTIVLDSVQAPVLLTASISNVRNVNLSWSSIGEITASDTLFFDGFESNDLLAWDGINEGTGTPGDNGGIPYWHTENDAYSGTYSAIVDWGYNINTRLTSNTFTIEAGQSLQFYWYSSYTWFVSPNDNGEITVEVSTNGGSSWTTIWSCDNIGVWDNATWYRTRISLADYAGQSIQISFHVVGNDNDVVVLDDVLLGTITDKQGTTNTPVSSQIAVSKSRSTLTMPSKTSILPLDKKTLTYYMIYRNGSNIGTSTSTSFQDNHLDGGTYTYQIVAKYVDPSGQSAASNSLQVIIPPSLLETVSDEKNQAFLYPNPSDGTFNLVVDEHATLRVLNLNGTLFEQREVEAGTNTLNINYLRSGIYIIHLVLDDRIQVLRAIVN